MRRGAGVRGRGRGTCITDFYRKDKLQRVCMVACVSTNSLALRVRVATADITCSEALGNSLTLCHDECSSTKLVYGYHSSLSVIPLELAVRWQCAQIK